MTRIIILLSTILLLMSTCTKDNDDKRQECNFENDPETLEGIIDNEEQEIMATCLENRLTTKEEIETNLIGTWKIIGYGGGWFPNGSTPCGNLEITTNEMTLKFTNEFIDTMIVHSWNVIERQNGQFYLETNPEFRSLLLSNFCAQYMFYNHTPFDGDMYIYEKID